MAEPPCTNGPSESRCIECIRTPLYNVLDVGGRPDIWNLLKQHYNLEPKRLTILNLPEDIENFEASHEEGDASSRIAYDAIAGDGTQLPFPDKGFDLTFSNSVIEHVGGGEVVIRFARECERVGKQVYIQTPNHWFPMDPTSSPYLSSGYQDRYIASCRSYRCSTACTLGALKSSKIFFMRNSIAFDF